MIRADETRKLIFEKVQHPEPQTPALRDRFQRQVDYLRLSLTDRCNLRCRYCMPSGPIDFEPQQALLSFKEIERLIRILAALGIRCVRLTGGEPLVRKGVPGLVRTIKQIPGIDEILMTTNGIRLAGLAHQLKAAGLKRINIHLDTLCPKKYAFLTRGGQLPKVLAGIEAARRVGMAPIKLNMVLQRGVNDEEVEDMLYFASRKGLVLRVIELMPIGCQTRFHSRFSPVPTLRQRLAEKYTFESFEKTLGSGPAEYEKVKELGVIVGWIASLSQPYCESCNRIRIAADGRFQDCLAFAGKFSLRNMLRDPHVTDEPIADKLRELIWLKRPNHNGYRVESSCCTSAMHAIGG